MRTEGYLSLVLHAHLPFIRHPEHPDFLEEDWLYEATTETYIPLLLMMKRLQEEQIPCQLTMSLTPPLCEMLADPLLQARYKTRLENLIELAQKEQDKQKGTSFQDASRHLLKHLQETHIAYTQWWQQDLLKAFRTFQDNGYLNIITCAATHGYLPLMATDEARRAQIKIGIENYKHHFGQAPQGIWLPECAYAPGLDKVLAELGIQYFFIESHGLLKGSPIPQMGTARPICTPNGVIAFGRDQSCSRQVWSADEGYPGDSCYREFYRDLGYDLPEEELGSYRHPDGIRRNLGLKYHRITGKVDLSQKQPYVPNWAKEKTKEHAAHFLKTQERNVQHLHAALGHKPHLTAPYDAELFGHWWYEGPSFLEQVFRQAANHPKIQLITPKQYLSKEPSIQVIEPAFSSWGANGYYHVWLNETNDWIYPHLHHAEEEMIALAKHFETPNKLEERALNQAARELVLAQSSDWAFIMTMQTTVPYAERRTREHLSRFHQLAQQLYSSSIDLKNLQDLEYKDNIFAQIDFRYYHPEQVIHPGKGTASYTAIPNS